ncbi:ABC transporter permease [Actinomadura sp. DC4]|uniref:ABC transporter permease n=1 Tax=Actinomadura sp. DC4 TaxID=3055069 RepID=UPI0025B2152C|nr:ABC transporter permease [Actinomadura sp. DC4]MDN3353136.1 ABC transporter permease [Actinomadura sp. DC4]
MSTVSLAARDSATMLRRNLRHALRYPSMSLSTAAMPIIFMLLFVYVFGSTLGAGIGGGRYVDYVAPGVILMTAAAGAISTSVSVCMDMTEGIVARFRTMAISRVSVLTGHVVGSMIQTAFGMVLVTGVALLIGFRPSAGPAEWAAAIGVLLMLTLALTWLAVAFGLVSDRPETASNLPLPLTLLPFLGSGFVPTGSMPAGVRQFAEYQPFTPITETLRGLLMGTPIGHSALIAVAWCAAIALGGYLWAKTRFNRAR